MPSRGRLLFRITAVLVLAAGVLLVILLATSWPSDLLRREVVRRVEGLTGGRLEIASVELRFFPPRAIARGILFQGGGPGGGTIRIACGEADVSLPYRVYRGKLDRIDSLRLVGPHIFIERGSGVPVSPAAPAPAVQAGRGIPSIGRVVVVNGSTRIRDAAAGWEIVLEETEVHAAGRGSGILEGSLEKGRYRLTKGGHATEGRIEAGFKLAGTRMEVESFHLNTPVDPFHAAGSAELDLGGPSKQFRVKGELLLAEPATPRDLIGDLSGGASVDLRGETRIDGLHLSGSAEVPEVGYRGWSGEGISLKVQYRPGDLRVTDLAAARFLGGEVSSGRASFLWGEEGFSKARFEGRGELKGGSMDEIARTLGLPSIPLTGRVNHTGDYRMVGFDPSTLEAEGDLQLTGQLRFGAREAVTGAGRFRIVHSTLIVEETSLSTAAASADFQGTIGLAGGKKVDGRLQVVSHGLDLLAPLLAPLPPTARAPLAEIVRDSPGSELKIEGRLTRDAGGVRLDARGEASSLELRGTRLGDLRADFSFSPSKVEVREASISGGATPLAFSGWLHPSGSGEPAFAIKGKGSGIDLGWLMDWTGLRIPAEGSMGAEFDLSRETGGLRGRVDWELDHPVAASIPLDAATGRLTLVPEGILVEEFRVSREEGSLEASGSIGLEGAPMLIYVNGEGIRAEWFRDAGMLPAETGGETRVQARVTGTLARPSVEMDLETPGLTVQGFNFGSVAARFNADEQGGELQICPEEKGIALTGRLAWSGALPFQADLEMEDFEVAASSFGGGLEGLDASAVLSGSVHASGALKDASRLEVTGTLERARVRMGESELTSGSPATFHWKPPRLELSPIHLVGAGTDLALSGTLEPEGRVYHFTAGGKIALAALQPFWPGAVLGGTGDLSFALSGVGAESRMEGTFGVTEGRAQGGGLPFPVSSLQGRLVLDSSRAFHLEGVNLLGGGGKIRIEGKGTLEGSHVGSVQFALKGQDVLIPAPKGFRGRYDLDLRFTQDASEKLLAGKIDLIRGVYNKDFELDRNFLSLGREEPALPVQEEPAAGADYFGTVGLDLDLEADRGLWILNDFATLEGTASFHVGGTVRRPEITGRFSALEGGIIRFRQVRYTVDRGNIDLVDPSRFNPSLDIAAETTVADYQVNLKLEGTLEKFTFELTSSPPLTQPEILALLVSGRSPDTFQETGRVAQDVASSYLTGGLASGLGGVIQGVTGFDQFSIDPVYLTNQGDPASRVTVGKQITENLFAAYSTQLGSTSEETYQLEYRISRDFKFTSTRQADGQVGGDLRYLLKLSTAPGAPASSAVPGPTIIRSIRVEGDPGMSRKKVERLLRVKPGKVLDRGRLGARADRLLKRYHRKGYWQAVVETREEPAEGQPGETGLILRVNAGPRLRVRLDGAPSPRKLKGKIESLWANSIFPEEIPEEARAKVEDTLREEGYYHARVEIKVDPDTPALREVHLTAQPGPRIRVEKIEFAGNESIPASRLEALMKTRPEKGDLLKPEQLAADAGRIRAHYLSLGYAEVRVSPPEIEAPPDGSPATVRYRIEEGEPTKIARVSVEGGGAIAEADLLKKLPLQPGAPYTREQALSGDEAIRQAYDRKGYTRAKVSHELRGEEGPALVYLVEEGPQLRAGKIEIEGNRLTRKEVVERELKFKEGGPLSSQEIQESQRALYRLGIFSSVEIQELPGEDPSRPTVRVRVAESKNLIQSLGVGYATDEGARGLYEVTNTNLFGRARTVGLQLRGSRVNNRIQFVLRDPYLFNRKLDSLLSTFRERRVRDSFTLTERGTTLQVSNKIGKTDRVIYRYLLKDEKVTDLQITVEEAGVESIRLSGFSGGFVHDSRDNFYNPRKGSFFSVDLVGYGKALGSEAAFVKFFAQGSLFHSLPWDSVWAQSARLGLADPFGISDSIPISERFFAGGDTTVRGFSFDQLGPKDPVTGEPTGGEALFIVNEELRFPIWRFLRGVVFFDAGNVTSRLPDFNPLVLRTVLGAGFRIDTPIGPIRFEYGWKLDREEGETPGELHITVGQAF